MILPKFGDRPAVINYRARAARRRAALVAAGCGTFELAEKHDQPVITCFCCGLTSYNDQDIELRYCGFCNAFHSDWGPDGNVTVQG
jgi:ribosomal protein L37E